MSDVPSLPPATPNRRPNERDALYNPALLAFVLAQAAAEYERRAGDGMPFTLAFLVPPIVMHAPTRAELPTQARSKMAPWLDAHPVQRAGLPKRAKSLTPAVRAGMRFGIRTGALRLEGATLSAPTPKLPRAGTSLSRETDDILKRSAYVGGWFALAGPPSAIYALWRIKP